MNFPADLKYAKSHEWVRQEGDTYVIGLTDFAQDELGDIVFVNLPQEGDAVSAGEAFSDVESVKAVSDVLSPVSGTSSQAKGAGTPETGPSPIQPVCNPCCQLSSWAGH